MEALQPKIRGPLQAEEEIELAEQNNQSQAPFWGGFPMCLRQQGAGLSATGFILVAKV